MYDHGLTNKRFGANLTRFGTLEHTVGETGNFICTSLNFSKIFFSHY